MTMLGRETTIYVGATANPTDALSYARNPQREQTPVKENTTTNDSGAGTNRDYIRRDYKLTVNVFAHRASAAQAACLAAEKNLTKVYALVRDEGDGTGLPQDSGLFTVEIKKGSPLNGRATIDIVFEIDGEIDDSVQA